MSHSAPLELITDVAGAVTFGWIDDGVYYARFSRSLSAKLGEAFAARLRVVIQPCSTLRYFGDARALESYDLLARNAFVRVVVEQRRKFESLTFLTWAGIDASPALIETLGDDVLVTKDPIDFEARLMAHAPSARQKLGGKPDLSQRSRWPLRR
ncbi:MAG TPA: hypothetical protein VJN18_10185 [Polyangiaceae bacterium]|nr:hypothetical protein [Polyangiaceae bacterium]